MKDVYRNPVFYYILAPAVMALWPLLVWGVYLPKAERNWKREKAEYNQAQRVMTEILTLDPERMDFADPNSSGAEFDYATAVERIASLCRIPPSNYKLSSGIITGSGEQKSQSAKVDLEDVSVTQFARFLSTIQLRWANLQCGQIKLNKIKGSPDKWDVDLQFKYYY